MRMIYKLILIWLQLGPLMEHLQLEGYRHS